MPSVFLARRNRKGQAILFRWQGTGGKLCERARRTVSLIEIDHDVARCIGWIDVEVASRWISLFATGFVGDDHEKPRLVFLSDGIEPVFLTVNRELDCTGR